VRLVEAARPARRARPGPGTLDPADELARREALVGERERVSHPPRTRSERRHKTFGPSSYRRSASNGSVGLTGSIRRARIRMRAQTESSRRRGGRASRSSRRARRRRRRPAVADRRVVAKRCVPVRPAHRRGVAPQRPRPQRPHCAPRPRRPRRAGAGALAPSEAPGRRSLGVSAPVAALCAGSQAPGPAGVYRSGRRKNRRDASARSGPLDRVRPRNVSRV
jgi:hypothetical protein